MTRELSRQDESGRPTQIDGALAESAAVPPAPKAHQRRSRARLTGGIALVLIAVAGAWMLMLGNSGSVLSQMPALAVVAILGILAVWAVAMLSALALCRTAAAGDQTMLDGERAAALRAELDVPVPFTYSAWAKGRRTRHGITATREPATPAASASSRASARQPAHS